MALTLTRHNGRAGKNGVYLPRHNDRTFDYQNSDHIDNDRVKKNQNWDCLQGLHDQPSASGKNYMSFEEVENQVYLLFYHESVEAQNERNIRNRHPERNRTTNDLLHNTKTCPEETIYQIGNIDETVSPDTLLAITEVFFAEIDRRYGDYVHILDWSLHLDETTPHIHERHVFDCEDKYGFRFPQQEKALEKMGFELPDPSKPKGKNNNRKMTFDKICRDLLFEICENHDLYLQRNPFSSNRIYLEKQDYILMKQKEKMAEQKQQIEKKEAELLAITVRIEDTESFVDEIADAAYEKAVEVVSKTVQEEVRNEDFDIIANKREEVLNDSRLGEAAKKYLAGVFSDMMCKFRGLSQHISERLKAIFCDPQKKEELQMPIKKSIKLLLAKNRKTGNKNNSKQRREKVSIER